MKRLFFISLFLFSCEILSQEHLCSLTTIEKNTINCLIENPDIGALTHENINKITEQIYLKSNFIFKNCNNINNALAVINPINNKRYIMLDIDYFNNISNNDYWFHIFILAHEIAHHINGHTIPRKGYTSILESQQKELDCDYFAGYILFKLGATENQIFNIFSKLPDAISESSSHPKNYKRLNYSLKGYKNEFNKVKKLLDDNREKIYSEIKNEDLNVKFKELLYNVDNYSITQNKKSLEIASYLLKYFEGYDNDDFNQLRAYIYFKNENYNLAINYYKENISFNKSTSNLIFYLSILDKLNLTDNSITNLNTDISEDPEVLLNLGIYFSKKDIDDKAILFYKKANDLIAEKEDSLLKADILIFYGRSLYDEQIKLNMNNHSNMNFNLSKSKFYDAKKIISRYPDDDNYKTYYNTLIFHLSCIAELEKNLISLEKLCLELIYRCENSIDKEIRNDYLYKSYFRLFQYYNSQKRTQESIQAISNAIKTCDDDKMIGYYYYTRANIYFDIDEFDLGFKDIEKSCNQNYSNSCEILKMKK